MKTGERVLKALRTAGYRVWNGNCQNLNPEDEAGFFEIIERESGCNELADALAKLEKAICRCDWSFGKVQDDDVHRQIDQALDLTRAALKKHRGE